MTGKDICKELKAIRRNIAEENGIDLEIPECTYQGPCRGTCPRCENEVRILERELSRRLSLGKMATVAGIALTLAGGTAAAATPVVPQKDLPDCGLAQHRPTGMADAHLNDTDTNYAFQFLLIDPQNDETIPYAIVVVKRNGDTVASTESNIDGLVTIKGLRDEEYDIEIRCIGYRNHALRNFKPMPISELVSIPVVMEMIRVQGKVLEEEVTPVIRNQAELTPPKLTKAEKRKAKKVEQKKAKAYTLPIIEIQETPMGVIVAPSILDANPAAEPLNIEDKPYDIPVPSLPSDTVKTSHPSQEMEIEGVKVKVK